jgi:hypothetical protein
LPRPHRITRRLLVVFGLPLGLAAPAWPADAPAPAAASVSTAPAPVTAPAKPVPPGMHEFTNPAGRAIIASILSVIGDRVNIQRDDGQQFTVPLASLSAADRDYIQGWAFDQAKGQNQDALTFTISEYDDNEVETSDATHMDRSLDSGYVLSVQNNLDLELCSLRIAYVFFVKHAPGIGRPPPLTRTQGQWPADSLAAQGSLTLKTDLAHLTRTQSRATIITEYTNGYKTSSLSNWNKDQDDHLAGIWVRIYDGDKLLQEWASNPNLMQLETWAAPVQDDGSAQGGRSSRWGRLLNQGRGEPPSRGQPPSNANPIADTPVDGAIPVPNNPPPPDSSPAPTPPSTTPTPATPPSIAPAPSPAPPAQPANLPPGQHQFTSQSGHTVIAAIVSVGTDGVTLRRDTGQTLIVPLSAFSESDQAYIEDWALDQALQQKQDILAISASEFSHHQDSTSLDGNKQSKNNSGYTITVGNQLNLGLSGLRAEYIYYWLPFGNSEAHMNTSIFKFVHGFHGAVALAPIPSQGNLQVDTKPFQPAPDPLNPSPQNPDNKLLGIWVRVYRGQKLIQEWCSASEILANQSWTDLPPEPGPGPNPGDP